jgi:hypothetical protein
MLLISAAGFNLRYIYLMLLSAIEGVTPTVDIGLTQLASESTRNKRATMKATGGGVFFLMVISHHFLCFYFRWNESGDFL